MTGFVSFVSSGPGDPELLTLKAVARLQAADAVLFDDLSSGPILAHVRTGADLVSVGKRAGRVSPRQQHVSRLLVDYATTHERVVRLKSGDAGIFGRLEEEIEALSAAGIGYEIIPGVPAYAAAAALLKTELTLPEISQTVERPPWMKMVTLAMLLCEYSPTSISDDSTPWISTAVTGFRVRGLR